MAKIINLTQHNATPDQVTDGVFDPHPNVKHEIRNLLTFDSPPNPSELRARAQELAAIAAGHNVSAAMIGGAPFFMSALERALLAVGITPVYAFSKREVIEEQGPDGQVVKRSVFKHVALVPPAV